MFVVLHQKKSYSVFGATLFQALAFPFNTILFQNVSPHDT